MQRLEVSCAVRRLYRSLGVKGLIFYLFNNQQYEYMNVKFGLSH